MPAYADVIPSTNSANNTKTEVLLDMQPDVVVTGMSGRFPESGSVEEFSHNLYNGVDMVTADDRRWTPGLHGLPHRSGKIPHLHQFDAPFFSVSPRQAHCMDPQLRILLEITYEAIVDAGYNPKDLRGKRIGVYVGVSQSETEEAWTSKPDTINGYGLTGCCRAMFANRISYTFDFKGPSFAVDTACSSSMVALQTAWTALLNNEIDAAIVAGTNLTLKPQSSMQFNALNMLAGDGKCKAFDESGNGYVRSEAAAAVFLQDVSCARRVYAHLEHARTNTDGHKGEGVTFPSGAVQKMLLQETYQKSRVPPSCVSYVEAHGTGTKVGDPQEVNALAEVLCTSDRSSPLLIGSVKSNMGHSEPASGLCSLVKVLLSMQKGEIPGNLHFHNPNPKISALVNGKIEVVNKNTKWGGGYAAINSFGFGGANVHILLRSPNYPRYCKEGNVTRIMPDRHHYQSTHLIKHIDKSTSISLPKLVIASGRTHEAVNCIVERVKASDSDALCGLVNELAETQVNTHPYRGFGVICEDETQIKIFEPLQEDTRPVWLIFSGMGSQWVGCGKQLMTVPTFARAIDRCRTALIHEGIDVTKVITSEDPSLMASTPASFATIAAVQVALVDVLRSVNLPVSGVVGHSVGELGCAYAEGGLSAEQTVLAGYWRGRAVQEANLPAGGMAAVGLSKEDAEKWCEGTNVIVACHNAHESVTISGPQAEVDSVAEKISGAGIFCRKVKSEGVAFHHPTLQAAAPKLHDELRKIIPNPRHRSEKWISSSIPESDWDENKWKFVSPEYLVHNLVSPVLFEEAIMKVPENALMVEVSPHGLLQAILRRAKPKGIAVPLIRKDAKNTVVHLFESLGRIYSEGIWLDLKVITPPMSYPVPHDTPSIASFIQWDHNVEWDVARFSATPTNTDFKVNLDLNEEELEYLGGHNIDGRVLFPATGYLVLVWKAVCQYQQSEWEVTPVTFSDVHLHQATVLTNNSVVTLVVRILLQKGEFEITNGETVVSSGKVSIGLNQEKEREYLHKLIKKMSPSLSEDGAVNLKKKDVYKELKLRGYCYQGLFQGVETANLQGTVGSLSWKDNWIPFLDTMLQFSLLGAETRSLMLPVRIRRVSVNPAVFKEALKENLIHVHHSKHLGVTLCTGVEIEGLKANLAPRRPISDKPLLETHQFIPYILKKNHKISSTLSEEHSVKILLDIVIENHLPRNLKVIIKENVSTPETINTIKSMIKICDLIPLMKLNVLYKCSQIPEELKPEINEKVKIVNEISSGDLEVCNLLVLEDLEIVDEINENTFILTNKTEIKKNLQNKGFCVVSEIETFNFVLLRKEIKTPEYDLLELPVTEEHKDFPWVEDLKEKILKEGKKTLCLVSNGGPSPGIVGMANCLRREPGGDKLRYIFISDKTPLKESKLKELTLSALRKNTVSNIYKDGVWGSLRHLPLESPTEKTVQRALLNVAVRGDLSSLTWYSSNDPSDGLTEEERHFIPCDVYCAPLNFRDIMLASGKLPPDALPGNLANKECILGLEFSGKNSEGESVMGLVPAGGLSTSVCADPLLVWGIPPTWSMKEAATVPVVYSTAYYALVVRGRLQKGDSVLIHSGSGGVGQAAIGICLSRGCTVYTTVSSDKKKAFLIRRFPQLTDENFSNSRDGTFELDILERTRGLGVDIVLNSLAGPLLQASVRCLKQHGRFLEIGKADLANNSALGMSILLKNVTVNGILLDAVFDGVESERKMLNHLLSEGIKNGEVRPLAYTSYPWNEAEEAFRFMASGKHIGKVVLDLKEDTEDQLNSNIKALDRVNVSGKEVYVLTGGLGGLGLELTDWLVKRGAKHIVVTSRRGPTQPYQHLCLKRWKAAGVDVKVLTQDSSTISGARKLLSEAGKTYPVGGIFHLAMVLQDSLLENQDAGKFSNVSFVKAGGAVALDIASRELCKELKYWVAFSSVACGRGNAGQSNYGWANSVCERIAVSRSESGLPAIAIQWGGIGDVGVLADTLGEIEVGGTSPQSVRSVMECLDVLLMSTHPVVSSMCLAVSSTTASEKGPDSLLKAVANILGIKDYTKAPMNITLGDLGLDSLMSVEVAQTIEREVDIIYSQTQIRSLTLTAIKELNNTDSPSNKEESNATTSLPKDQIRQWDSSTILPKDIIVELHKGDPKIPPLFIASPIEGNCNNIIDLSANIRAPVYALQYPAHLPNDNIKDMSAVLIKEIKAKTNGKPFHLGGYSFGACIAFEMTRQLESSNEAPVSLVLLDGSHSYVASIIHDYKNKYSTQLDEKVLGEVESLCLFSLQFYQADVTSLRKTLFPLPSFDDRIKVVAETLHKITKDKNIDCSIEQLQSAALNFYNRLKAGLEHGIPECVLRSSTLLVRATGNSRAETVGKDYGLTKVTSQLQIIETEGTHETFLAGPNSTKVSGDIHNFWSKLK